MLVNEITFTNKNGDSATFSNERHFRLTSGFDLSELTATVNTTNSGKNGATYQSTKLDVVDFDIEFYIMRNYESDVWIEDQRHELFKVFNPLKNPIRIDFITKGDKEYFITAELLGTPSLPMGFENSNRNWQKGLLQFNASDPFVYEATETKTEVVVWSPMLEFPLELVTGGIEVGSRSPSLIVDVENRGSYDTGMIIQFKAASAVVNPKLLNVVTYEELKLNFTMQAGDVIEINTFTGSRTATLIRGGTTTNIFGRITLSSTFLQLRVGDNLLRYDADSGLDFLECTISHRNTLIGV